MITVQKTNLCEIADEAIKKLNERTDPFETPVLVFHNTKIAQWFKAYFLKTNGGILMNVEFRTLSAFINELLNPRGDFRILSRTELRLFLIRALSEIKKNEITEENDALNYIFEEDGRINGINLYSFADKLSTVLINMEYDNEDVSGWEKDIFERASKLAEKENCYTPKTAFEKKFEDIPSDSPVYIIDNSYISALYNNILNKTSRDITVFALEEETEKQPENISCFSAPSVMRETEALHSDICKILKDNKEIRVNDFVVYAPDISVYANTIRRVFQQDGKEFPDIPFVISGENREKRNMKNSLSLLYEIANRHFFTRYDLQRFLKNEMIMKIRGLTDEQADSFLDAVVRTNSHRNGSNGDDWDYFKKRTLLTFLVDSTAEIENKTELSGGVYLPFSSISLDRQTLNKGIDIIDSLLAWTSLFSQDLRETVLDSEKLERAGKILDLLYSATDCDGRETNYLYTEVKTEVERIKTTVEQIPATAFLLLLSDAPNRTSTSPANVFSGGVTFLNLNCDNVVPAEYTYVLGMSSANFPRTEIKNEIDFSKNHKQTQELDEITVTNLLKASENITFSYVNKDLKTDVDFYPSESIPEAARKNITEIPLDETRAYSELFTKKAMLDKQYFTGIGKNSDSKEVHTPEEEMPVQDTISTADIKSYLTNTLIYKYKKLLKDSDGDDEIRTEEYEPVDMSILGKYSIVKELILDKIGNQENVGEAKLSLEKKLPAVAEKELYGQYEAGAEATAKVINDGYKLFPKETLKFTTEENRDWFLNVNSTVYYKEEEKENGKTVSFVTPEDFTLRSVKIKHYFAAYACALAFVASQENVAEYTVILNPVNGKEKKFQLELYYAKNVLNELFKRMTDYSSIKYMDYKLLENGKEKSIESIMTDEHGDMNYFNDKKLLTEADFGYSDGKSKMSDELKEIIKLVKFLQQNETTGEGEA